MVWPLLTVILTGWSMLTANLQPASAQQVSNPLRYGEVGGYAVSVYDVPTYEYPQRGMAVSGHLNAGQFVYINAWLAGGVYEIGEKQWIGGGAVVPVLNAAGTAE